MSDAAICHGQPMVRVLRDTVESRLEFLSAVMTSCPARRRVRLLVPPVTGGRR